MKNLKYVSKAAMTLALPLLLTMCAKDSDKTFNLSSKVSFNPEATIAGDQAATSIWFSTNGGTSYTLTPFISVGQKFKVQVMDNVTGEYLATDNWQFDWSQSSPAPDDATSATPEFTLTDNTSMIALVDNKHCDYTSSTWLGTWKGDEVGAGVGGTDTQTVTAGSDDHTFIMDNYWGIGQSATFTFSQSTNAHDQIVSFPQQTIPGPFGGSLHGEGTYDQCAGVYTIHTFYSVPSGPATGDYEFDYNFYQ
jgi:hypothetical protein